MLNNTVSVLPLCSIKYEAQLTAMPVGGRIADQMSMGAPYVTFTTCNRFELG